jgi:hypothetical protein
MLVPFAIYIVVPLLGLLAFVLLLRLMRRRNLSDPPAAAFFLLFFTLGGWLEVLLTAWLWEWSGMASLGVLYLLIIAPVLTAWVSWKLRTQRLLSGFHQWAFILNGTYPFLAVVAIGLWLSHLGQRS